MSKQDNHDRYSQELSQLLFGETNLLHPVQSNARTEENRRLPDRTSELLAAIHEILEETSSRELMNFGTHRERMLINAQSLQMRESTLGSIITMMTSRTGVSNINTRTKWKRCVSESDLSSLLIIRHSLFVDSSHDDQDPTFIAHGSHGEYTPFPSRIFSFRSNGDDDDAKTI
jgi:hypothetical protein